MLPQVGFDICF